MLGDGDVVGGAPRELNFTIELDATRDLAIDASRVEALITIKARPAERAAPVPRMAEVLIMDRSLSMMSQHKIHEARRAACAAIDALPDGVLLGIIAGNRTAEPVFPLTGGLASIDAETKAAAKRQVMGLWPEGGTEIGRWLVAAGQLFATAPAGAVCHAVLYTDGKNEHETPAALEAALNSCADRFVCDVRGLGDDWHYSDLLRIAEALHGDATAVLRIADLTDDFIQLIHRARHLVVPRTYLRLSPSDRFQIGSITQTNPVRVDLTQRQQPAGGTAVDVPLGSWQAETRCYQLTLRFTPDTLPTGEDLRAARVELLAETADGKRERYADAALIVHRHAIPGFRTRMPDSLTRVEKERELIMTMQACADARLHGQIAEADDELDHAIRLARVVADPVRLRLLESIAILGPDGRARLRPDVRPGELQRLGLESTKTAASIAVVIAQDEVDQGPAEAHRCRACGETTYVSHPRHCEACGAPFDDEPVP